MIPSIKAARGTRPVPLLSILLNRSEIRAFPESVHSKYRSRHSSNENDSSLFTLKFPKLPKFEHYNFAIYRSDQNLAKYTLFRFRVFAI